ncbi:unnamed protein product, partial [Polarella glacialis]
MVDAGEQEDPALADDDEGVVSDEKTQGRRASVSGGRRGSVTGGRKSVRKSVGLGRRASIPVGPDGRRRSQAALLDPALLALLREQQLEEKTTRWWTSPWKALWVLFRRCRRRAKKVRKNAGAAIGKEVADSWGKTSTSKAFASFQRTSPNDLRAQVGDKLVSLYGKFTGRDDNVDRQNKRRHRGGVWLAGKQSDNEEAGFGIKNFIIDNTGYLDDFYDIEVEIGAGGSAKVYKCIEKQTHVARAVKVMVKKSTPDFARLVQEVAVMKTLDHPNIVKLFETFEDDQHIFLVMELCTGGDVQEKLVEQGVLTEAQTSIVIRAVLGVLAYLHANHYVHRDIKPENVMYKDNRADAYVQHLRVVDFGYSCMHQVGHPLMTKVGSPYYVAPEVLAGSYDCRCDIWSCGVLAYMALVGYPPFAGLSDAETLRMVKKGEYFFHKSTWSPMSKLSKNFIRKLMQVDPDKRYTIDEALAHPWLRASGWARPELLRDATVDRLVSFCKYHRLRRSAMLAVAYHLEADEITVLRDLFRGMDLNSDGVLTSKEFQDCVVACGISPELVKEMMISVDADGSGTIDYSEFIAATLESHMYVQNYPALLRAFRSFDQDGSGGLTVDEVAETLECDCDSEMERIFEEVDTNKDGVMDFGEFYTMLGFQLVSSALEEDQKPLALDYLEIDSE